MSSAFKWQVFWSLMNVLGSAILLRYVLLHLIGHCTW